MFLPRTVIWLAVALWIVGTISVFGQAIPPNINPVSNQGWTAAVITVGTTYQTSRAVYNGNATACNITFTMNGNTASVLFQNVQSGQILPIQTINVSATTCGAGTLVEIY